MQFFSRFKNKAKDYEKVYGILGDPVCHSRSPLFWNKAFEALGLSARYFSFHVKPDELKQAFKYFREIENLGGFNITVPHKSTAALICSKLEFPANILGAVNTIKILNNELVGYNTDATGFSDILAKTAKISKATVLGNGGASLAVVWALIEKKVPTIFWIARNHQKTNTDWLPKDRKGKINLLEWGFNELKEAIISSNLVINTTPLGWNADDRIEELELFLDKNKIYVDLNYSLTSKLIRAAQVSRANLIDGRELLLQQGLKAFRLLTGFDPPENIIRNCIYNI